MRILFAGPRSAWVRYNLLNTFRSMGHDLVTWDWGMGWPDTGPGWKDRRARIGERLVRFARRRHRRRPFDLIFCYLYSTAVGPEAVDALRTLGSPVVNFSCNNVHQFHLVQEIAPRFDACIVPERSALPDYQAAGARAIHLGMAANPRFYRPYPVAQEFDVTFVGQRYADRADHVLHLKRHGVDVRVWGAGWRSGMDPRGALAGMLSIVEDEGPRALLQALSGRVAAVTRRIASSKVRVSSSEKPQPWADRLTHTEREPFNMEPQTGDSGAETGNPELETQVSELGARNSELDLELRPIAGHRLLQREMVALFSRSRISLGFATVGDTHRTGQRLTQVRLRDFEAPMSGAFYITEDQEELREYFEVGREVETYGDKDELLEKVRFYLRHPEQAQAIRQAGRTRALADHTWERRFSSLFHELRLKAGSR